MLEIISRKIELISEYSFTFHAEFTHDLLYMELSGESHASSSWYIYF